MSSVALLGKYCKNPTVNFVKVGWLGENPEVFLVWTD